MWALSEKGRNKSIAILTQCRFGYALLRVRLPQIVSMSAVLENARRTHALFVCSDVSVATRVAPVGKTSVNCAAAPLRTAAPGAPGGSGGRRAQGPWPRGPNKIAFGGFGARQASQGGVSEPVGRILRNYHAKRSHMDLFGAIVMFLLCFSLLHVKERQVGGAGERVIAPTPTALVGRLTD